MWTNAVLLSAAAICVATDLKNRKIYNAVIFPSLAAALLIHACQRGWSGLAEGLLGFLVGLGILLIPYLMGGMGAGDVKMLALVGMLKGMAFVLESAVYMALIGAVIAIGVWLLHEGLRARMQYLGFVCFCLRMKVFPVMRGGDGTAGSITYPYGVAIAGGAVLCLALKGWGAA
ncbi:A24 family peptidase [Cohnella candidum]|uniref:Prepilin peptidase n=1 Tax=Cohnella candidum TaxID=2674991 RepID=A0A3G3K3E8_9BACL|nr:A24 family peptidase [Cohnella candidum]AYQ75003.1 prepilin peptidase [Cohnella candidum]